MIDFVRSTADGIFTVARQRDPQFWPVCLLTFFELVILGGHNTRCFLHDIPCCGSGPNATHIALTSGEHSESSAALLLFSSIPPSCLHST